MAVRSSQPVTEISTMGM